MSGARLLDRRLFEIGLEARGMIEQMRAVTDGLKETHNRLERLDALRVVGGVGPYADGVCRLPGSLPTWTTYEICGLASVEHEVVRLVRVRARGVGSRQSNQPFTVRECAELIASIDGGNRSSLRARVRRVLYAGIGLPLDFVGVVRTVSGEGPGGGGCSRGVLGDGLAKQLNLCEGDGLGVPFVRAIEEAVGEGTDRLRAIDKVSRADQYGNRRYLEQVMEGVAVAGRLHGIGGVAGPFGMRLRALIVATGVDWYRGCELLDAEHGLGLGWSSALEDGLLAVGECCRAWLWRSMPEVVGGSGSGGGDG